MCFVVFLPPPPTSTTPTSLRDSWFFFFLAPSPTTTVVDTPVYLTWSTTTRLYLPTSPEDPRYDLPCFFKITDYLFFWILEDTVIHTPPPSSETRVGGVVYHVLSPPLLKTRAGGDFIVYLYGHRTAIMSNKKKKAQETSTKTFFEP